MKNYLVVIPARLKSSRLPNKPLLKIGGIPMIIRTYNQCNKVVKKDNIIVATDSYKIINVCKKNNINTILTSKNCKTGTDRIFQVSKKIKAKNYINVQGDEPILNPKDLSIMIKNLNKNHNTVLLGYCEFWSRKIMKNHNIPKVVFDKNKKLLYATRSSIPSNKKNNTTNGFRQILIYTYPKKIMDEFYQLYNKKGSLEKSEDIEILRFIENNIDTKLIKMSDFSKSVDTQKDLKEVESIIKNNNKK